MQEWPPVPGSTFDVSILAFSFANDSFWRGRHVAMSEIVALARSMIVTRFREAGGWRDMDFSPSLGGGQNKNLGEELGEILAKSGGPYQGCI